jgi:hypothetical protein
MKTILILLLAFAFSVSAQEYQHYVYSPTLPPDAVELNPDQPFDYNNFWHQRPFPFERPEEVPLYWIIVKVFQRPTNDQTAWYFRGYQYMDPADVNELHTGPSM